MTHYHADSPVDIKAQFSTEGDLLRRAGFSEPNFSDEPEERQVSLTGAVVVPTTEQLSAYDEASQMNMDVEDYLQG